MEKVFNKLNELSQALQGLIQQKEAKPLRKKDWQDFSLLLDGVGEAVKVGLRQLPTESPRTDKIMDKLVAQVNLCCKLLTDLQWFSLAISLLNIALIAVEAFGHQLSRDRLLNELGKYQFWMGKDRQALPDFQTAIERLESRGDYFRSGWVRVNLSGLYLSSDEVCDPHLAEKVVMQGLQGLQQVKTPSSDIVARLLLNLGEAKKVIARQEGSLAKHRKEITDYFQQAISLLPSGSGDIVIAQVNLAETQYITGDSQAKKVALLTLRRMAEGSERRGEREWSDYEVHGMYSKLLQLDGQKAEAVRQCKLALKAAVGCRMPSPAHEMKISRQAVELVVSMVAPLVQAKTIPPGTEIERTLFLLNDLEIWLLLNELLSFISVKDEYMGGEHSDGVADLSGMIEMLYLEEVAKREGRAFNTGDALLTKFTWLCGKLHDLGKIGVKKAVLNKPDRLDSEEWEHIKSHPFWGNEILVNCGLSFIAKYVGMHHTNFKGEGYGPFIGQRPDKTAAKIMMADVTESLGSEKRPYHEPFSRAETIDYVKGKSGSVFDPELVKFLPLLFAPRNKERFQGIRSSF